MSTLLRIVSFIALAIGVFVAVITVVMLSNGRLDPTERTPYILIMLIAFPLAVLTQWWAKRIVRPHGTKNAYVSLRERDRNRS